MVKSSFRATGSAPKGSTKLRLVSSVSCLSERSGEIFFRGEGRSMSWRLLVGVPGSFLWEPRVRRTVGGSSGSGSDSGSDGGAGECWCFLDGEGSSTFGDADEEGSGGLEST